MTAPAGVQHRVLGTLAVTQVLGACGTAAGIAVSALAAAELSGSPAVGGLAATAATVGSALLAVPAAALAQRRGRRPALLLGYGVGAAGALLAVLALVLGSALLLIGALCLYGGGSMAGLAARYAATDLAPPDRRARALSVVVWASTLGVVLGPNLAGPTGRLVASVGLPVASGAYLVTAACLGGSALVVGLLLRPDPLLTARSLLPPEPEPECPAHGSVTVVPPRTQRAAAWKLLRGRTALAVWGIVLSHASMVGLMSMTPVHLDHGGHSLDVVGLVVSVHAAAMYVASPVFGWLADRHGRIGVMGVGAALVVAAAGLAATADDTDAPQLAVSLVVLGFAWSAGIVAGSALLTETVPLADRPAVQGLSDLLMNIGGAAGGVLAGVLVTAGSFALLGLVVGVLALPLLVVCAGLALRD
ncbi:MFS family permease [Crossiella equi]|uniref:MFS family permease n=1 Tax=Crossiella equi TaxID=130796 RepID=A0ABS5AAW5_9PSEU|nr:MFS transporter [Crossiella equi]MBP2473720.1 MFS family permease [Crossiella equi]